MTDLIDRKPEAIAAAWESSATLATRLIIDGHVDADNDAYDGVRALYQALYGLPITGYSCPEIREIERRAQRTRKEFDL